MFRGLNPSPSSRCALLFAPPSPQHCTPFCPHDIFKPFHIVEFIKELLRAMCQNARLHDPDDVLVTHFMLSGVEVLVAPCNPRSPAQEVYEGSSEGAQS